MLYDDIMPPRIYLKCHIDLTQDLDKLWHDIRKKRRSDIKRAERVGITVYLNTNLAEYAEIYYQLYLFLHRNVKKLRIEKEIALQKEKEKVEKTYSWNEKVQELERQLTENERNGKFRLIAKDKEGEVLAGETYMCSLETGMVWLRTAVSKRYIPEKKTMAGLAHALVIWESIKLSKKLGFKIWETPISGEAQIRRNPHCKAMNFWKKSFGGRIVEASYSG